MLRSEVCDTYPKLPLADRPIVVATGNVSDLAALAPHSLGDVLLAALKGRTHGLHIVVGYFSHGASVAPGSPDALIQEELTEVAANVEQFGTAESSMSLAFGQVVSKEAALAIRAWAALCQWSAAFEDQANQWRGALLNRIAAEAGQPKKWNASNWLPQAIARTGGDEFGAWLASAEGEPWHQAVVDLAKDLKAHAVESASRLAALLCARLGVVRCGQNLVGSNAVFHPKIYVIERVAGEAGDTVVAIGSGNWSANAFSAGAERGNVELGLAFHLTGRGWRETESACGDEFALRLVQTAKTVFGACEPLCKWQAPVDLARVEALTRVVKSIEFDVTATDREPPPPRAEKLTDCTPLEQAQLGLWRMIDEFLGTDQALHGRAVDYQRAAYQRQAAQRLVSILERIGGAMLCDGVGLGKTYIATTIIVHYCNDWTLRHHAEPGSAPFRISVLAPHSVASTWKTEALPNLEKFGVAPGSVRVLSHPQFSKFSASSPLFASVDGDVTDFEHFLLSDLVIIDEAHNFRAESARRTKILRDLLALQPRRDQRRKVLLLTATPINNGLEDLRQQLSLLFSKADHGLSSAREPSAYRAEFAAVIEARTRQARGMRTTNDLEIAGLLAHGDTQHKFSEAIAFEPYRPIDNSISNLGMYLTEQEKKLVALQGSLRDAAEQGKQLHGHGATRIADVLLDRVVVQRSRALCKTIENEAGLSRHENLLFRKDAETVNIHYSDEYAQTTSVLKRFLPLFAVADVGQALPESALSLNVYMWFDVKKLAKKPDELSTVVGLQRMLILKRLESSPVAFLITLLRLVALHARQIADMHALCRLAHGRGVPALGAVEREMGAAIAGLRPADVARVRQLVTDEGLPASKIDLISALASAHSDERLIAGSDDMSAEVAAEPAQQPLALNDTSAAGLALDQASRLLPVYHDMARDFLRLLPAVAELANIVFAGMDELPRHLVARGAGTVRWPESSPTWGLRVITDAKLRALVEQLILARRGGKKVIVFSQFTDTLEYISSVFRAAKDCSALADELTRNPDSFGPHGVHFFEIQGLLVATRSVTSETADREDLVDRFAPYYRIGPYAPQDAEVPQAARPLRKSGGESKRSEWERRWTLAIRESIQVLLASDVLAEGVNLQDAAVLINFDIHWNPVRMIQRSGRIDRRLKPEIEERRNFADLDVLVAQLGGAQQVPKYFWHDRPSECPLLMNMVLPDELEKEIMLRDRIGNKVLAIDLTLGLAQGTGVEAKWMESYIFKGVTALRGLEQDRAIELLGMARGHLVRSFPARGISLDWSAAVHKWFLVANATNGSPVIARLRANTPRLELRTFTRFLQPVMEGATACWPVANDPGSEWLAMDGTTWPPAVHRTLAAAASMHSSPLSADHLLHAAALLSDPSPPPVTEVSRSVVGKLIQQGARAITVPALKDDQESIRVPEFFVLQIPEHLERIP